VEKKNNKYFYESLTQIINLTVAYKEEHIDKKELNEGMTWECIFATLRVIKFKEPVKMISTAQLSATLNRSNFILMQPKPRFKCEGTNHDRELIEVNYKR